MNDRPKSLREIAVRAEDLGHFGHEFADWLHTLRTVHWRDRLRETIAAEPPLLRDRFPGGAVADAWLAAYAQHLAQRTGLEIPVWTAAPERISPEPWFAAEGAAFRVRALRDSPPAFKNRNLFTDTVDLPLRLRAGRPPTSAEDKRRVNAERQRRFRARRAVELELLHQAGKILSAGS
jgi:hypothetical protein